VEDGCYIMYQKKSFLTVERCRCHQGFVLGRLNKTVKFSSCNEISFIKVLKRHFKVIMDHIKIDRMTSSSEISKS
jgi:hypothetical protein